MSLGFECVCVGPLVPDNVALDDEPLKKINASGSNADIPQYHIGDVRLVFPPLPLGGNSVLHVSPKKSTHLFPQIEMVGKKSGVMPAVGFDNSSPSPPPPPY